MKKNKSQKAFTLIELLVVMAIIAILSAIMFGPIQTARRRSKDTQAVADMKLIANDLELYAQDNGGVYPASPTDAKIALQAYGNVPTRFTTSSAVNSGYNYYAIKDTNSNVIGFHLWTKLNDTNEAFNSDADCNSASLSSCWTGGSTGAGFPSTATTSESNLSASVCIGTNFCILDYANGK